jgi:hypothetical protein
MTKKATTSTKKSAGEAADAHEAEAPAARVVKYVVNRPYSAGEAPDIVDAEVTHEYEGEEDLLRLRLVNPPRGVEDDVKRVRRSDRREVGTWFEPAAPGELAEEVAE